jgi:hypothetical protein
MRSGFTRGLSQALGRKIDSFTVGGQVCTARLLRGDAESLTICSSWGLDPLLGKGITPSRGALCLTFSPLGRYAPHDFYEETRNRYDLLIMVVAWALLVTVGVACNAREKHCNMDATRVALFLPLLRTFSILPGIDRVFLPMTRVVATVGQQVRWGMMMTDGLTKRPTVPSLLVISSLPWVADVGMLP